MNIQNKVPKEVEPGTGEGKAFNCIKTVQITKKWLDLDYALQGVISFFIKRGKIPAVTQIVGKVCDYQLIAVRTKILWPCIVGCWHIWRVFHPDEGIEVWVVCVERSETINPIGARHLGSSLNGLEVLESREKLGTVLLHKCQLRPLKPKNGAFTWNCNVSSNK